MKINTVNNNRIHDFRNDVWGHALSMFTHSKDDETKATTLGHGLGIRVGDMLAVRSSQNVGGFTVYSVKSISYFNDPHDMFKAELNFVPTVSCNSCYECFETEELSKDHVCLWTLDYYKKDLNV